MTNLFQNNLRERRLQVFLVQVEHQFLNLSSKTCFSGTSNGKPSVTWRTQSLVDRQGQVDGAVMVIPASKLRSCVVNRIGEQSCMACTAIEECGKEISNEARNHQSFIWTRSSSQQ
jgi:hypothetical protein